MGTTDYQTRTAATRAVSAPVRVLLLCLAALFALGISQARAQTAGAVLHGSVVDAHSSAPVADATVVLEPEQTGAFPGTGSMLTTTSRTTSTDRRGHYRFDDLTPGLYRVYVTRLGYRSYTVVVELKNASRAISVGLEAEPIALEPLRSRTRSQGPFVAAVFGPEADDVRMRALALRRQQYLSTDVRQMTHADVMEGVTLGEPDIFRALQRLPGVSTRSDYTAELWTRGAPWAQTRVYYDGLPLFNPLHALGMLSGVGASSLRTVWFHPGVRPAAMAEGAAGVLDLQSRRGVGTGALNIQADASLMTAGVALDQRVLDGRAGWRLSARRSYTDWLAELAHEVSGNDGPAFPYSFNEVSGHTDAWVGDRSSVSASFLWEGDRLGSASATDPVHADWGNTLVQGTWSTRVGQLNVQHTAGYSEHAGAVEWDSTTVDLNGSESSFTIVERDQLARTGIRYVGVRGSIWPEARTLSGPAWTAGYEVMEQRARYRGPFPLPFPRASTQSLTVPDANIPLPGNPGDPLYVEWATWLPVVALWGETTWSPDDRWTVRAGLRAEASEEIENVGPVRLAPRVSVRYSPRSEVAFSAGYTRVYQYAQSLAPAGVQLASLVSTDVWLVAGPEIPAIQSDIWTAGLEASIGPGRLVTLNGFRRVAGGVTVPDPRSGPVLDRQLFKAGRSTAHGVEASVRQLVGPVTGSFSYSWSRSRMTVDNLEFPAAADRTHVLNATAMVRVFEPFRFGAAFTAATGVPFTRTISDPDVCSQVPGCNPDALPWIGQPNAFRSPTYASLDLMVDWSAEWAGLDVGVYGQLRNVLGRENAVVYAGNGDASITVGCSIDELRNAYERGVPRLPVVGIRVRR